MPDHDPYDKLLYQYEVVLARLTIREHYLKTVVKEVYENIGQVLSLIRVQLSSFQAEKSHGGNEKINSSGELVGQAIRELRTMCQLFYPEEEMISSSGFCNAVAREIKAQYPGAECQIPEESEIRSTLNMERGLLLFGIMLEIVSLIRENQAGQIITAEIKFTRDKILISIVYIGENIRRKKTKKTKAKLNLSVFERAALMGGVMEIKKSGHGNRRIKFTVPIK